MGKKVPAARRVRKPNPKDHTRGRDLGEAFKKHDPITAIAIDFDVVKRVRVRSFHRGVLLGAVAGAAFVALAACGGDDPVAAGGVCSVASDCQLGLICVPISGKSVCSSDLSKVAGEVAPDGAVAAADGAADDATTGVDTGTTPVKDAGVVDTGKPDTGPVDSGAG